MYNAYAVTGMFTSYNGQHHSKVSVYLGKVSIHPLKTHAFSLNRNLLFIVLTRVHLSDILVAIILLHDALGNLDRHKPSSHEYQQNQQRYLCPDFYDIKDADCSVYFPSGTN